LHHDGGSGHTPTDDFDADDEKAARDQLERLLAWGIDQGLTDDEVADQAIARLTESDMRALARPYLRAVAQELVVRDDPSTEQADAGQ
jgi:hypothetical protein